MRSIALKPHIEINTRTKGFFIALLGAALMSIDPVFIRFAGVSGFDTAFLFGLFTAISMPIVLRLNDKRGLTRAVKESGWPLLLPILTNRNQAKSKVSAGHL